MAYKKHIDLTTDVTISLGGKDKNGKANPISIEGYYFGSKATPAGDFGPGVLHFFQTAKGMVGVWGKANLNRILTDARIGQMCLVTFTGMGKAANGKRPPYNYELQYNEENTVEVAGTEPGASEPDYSEDEDGGYEGESDVDADEVPADEVPAPRAAAPKKPLSTPSAATGKRVQDVLNRRTG